MRITLLPFIILSTSIPASAVVTIDFVTIGNAGNAADTNGYGAVAHQYSIARNETTVAQYAEFLNAAAKSDSYSLYNSNMATGQFTGSLITRSGSSGSYSYTVTAGRENMPIVFVSWFDAARFINWLHNGQGSGSTETGVYNLNGATSGIFEAQAGAKYWLPTEDEWYKAAYYDPTKNSGDGGYWLYPNQTDSLPGNTIGIEGAANYFDGDYVGSGTSSQPSGNALTEVGIFGASSQSYYGTNDQGGNAREWNDAIFFEGSSWRRGLRGGSWTDSVLFPSSSYRSGFAPTSEGSGFGFRVASVPEPSGALVLALLLGKLSSTRRRR